MNFKVAAAPTPPDTIPPPIPQSELDDLASQLQSGVSEKQYSAAAAFARLSLIRENQKPIGETTGAIPGLVARLASPLVWIVQAAAAALASLTHDPGNRTLIGREHFAIDYLVALLKSPHTVVQEAVAKTLGNLAVKNENKDKIVAIDAVFTTLVARLKSPHAGVQEAAALALSNLIDATNQAKIGKTKGAIPNLVLLLAEHNPIMVQAAAATALEKLAGDASNQAKIANFNALPAIFQILRNTALVIQRNTAA